MLYHVERGTGVPVLALHGWWPDHRLMLGCLEPVFAARPGYRRLYPDLPGMGRSPAPPEVASADDVLAAVEQFVDRTVGAEPFLVVGESYGGYLARAVTAARPEQVRGLALVCPPGIAVEHADRRVPPRQVLRRAPELLAAADPEVATEYADVAVVQDAAGLQRFAAEIMPGVTVADGVALERIRRRWVLSRNPEAGPPFARPTLVITGRQDDRVGYEDQYALLPHYPRATFVVLDAAGHNLQLEQPRLFEALVHEWLDRVAWQS